MNCTKVTALLSAYIDGELTGAEMLEIRRHISSCSDCEREMESIKFIKRALSDLPAVQPREGFEDMIFARLDTVKVPGYVRFFDRIGGLFSGKAGALTASLAATVVVAALIGIGSLVPTSTDYYNENRFNLPVAEIPQYAPSNYYDGQSSAESQFTAPLQVVSDADAINGNTYCSPASFVY